MEESYFEYTLARCSDSVIPSVCGRYKTKAELLEAAQKGFNANNHILGQGLLIHAAIDFTAEKGYLNSYEFNSDGRKVFTRCTHNLSEMHQENNRHIDIDREWLFNVLVDFNWLFSSKYTFQQRHQHGEIALLESPAIIRSGLYNGLTDIIYEAALYDQDREEQYKTAQLTRYQIFSGCHPDSQVRELFGQGCTYSGFKELEKKAHESSLQHIALYYGLTVTAARAEEIRRMR